MTGPFEKNLDTTRNYSLSIDFSPYMDFLEDSGASPRETVEAIDRFEHVFEDSGSFEMNFRFNWDHISDGKHGWIHLDRTYFDPLSERGEIEFEMEYGLTEIKEEHLREAIEDSLDRAIGNCSIDYLNNPEENSNVRSHGYEFDADHYWNDDALVITGPDE